MRSWFRGYKKETRPFLLYFIPFPVQKSHFNFWREKKRFFIATLSRVYGVFWCVCEDKGKWSGYYDTKWLWLGFTTFTLDSWCTQLSSGDELNKWSFSLPLPPCSSFPRSSSSFTLTFFISLTFTHLPHFIIPVNSDDHFSCLLENSFHSAPYAEKDKERTRKCTARGKMEGTPWNGPIWSVDSPCPCGNVCIWRESEFPLSV